MSILKLGLIGLVHEDARQDFWGAMRRVAAIGYNGVESPGVPESELVGATRRFQEMGLRVAAVSIGREALLAGDLDPVIARAHALETRNVICYWGPCESKDQLLRDAEAYNRAGARLASQGLRFCYHNHEHEFKTTFDGVYALDLLAANTDPGLVSFEVDIAWVTFGGEDPVRILQRYAGRVPIIHVKDLWGLQQRGMFTAVGTGVVRIGDALRAAAETGVEWAVIEQDEVRNLDAWQTVTVSYLNLKEQGF